MKRQSSIRYVCVTGALLLGTAAPLIGHAELIQTSAVECRDADASNKTIVGKTFGQNGFGEVSNDSGGTTTVFCPVDRFTNISVASVTVDGYSNQNGGINVRACAIFRGGFGGSCIGSASPGGQGVGVFAIPTSIGAWINNPNDYRVLWIDLLPKNTQGMNTIFGYRQN